LEFLVVGNRFRVSLSWLADIFGIKQQDLIDRSVSGQESAHGLAKRFGRLTRGQRREANKRRNFQNRFEVFGGPSHLVKLPSDRQWASNRAIMPPIPTILTTCIRRLSVGETAQGDDRNGIPSSADSIASNHGKIRVVLLSLQACSFLLSRRQSTSSFFPLVWTSSTLANLRSRTPNSRLPQPPSLLFIGCL
jgi:hypothetical protein